MKTITDLLDIESGIIMHQVNCIGATGGLAGALRRRWPKAFHRYVRMCEAAAPRQGRLLGDFMCDAGDYALVVCHIFGQISPGPNTHLPSVDFAMERFKFFLGGLKSPLPLYAPYKMGCGLGGGNWEEYSKIIEKHLPHCIIVRRPEDK